MGRCARCAHQNEKRSYDGQGDPDRPFAPHGRRTSVIPLLRRPRVQRRTLWGTSVPVPVTETPQTGTATPDGCSQGRRRPPEGQASHLRQTFVVDTSYLAPRAAGPGSPLTS